LIVLDASAVIAFLARSDALHLEAVATIKALGPQSFGLSPITHAEILVGPTRAGTLDRTRAAIAALGVTEVPLPPDAAPRLASLRASTRLKLPDCCVVLAAQQSAAAVLTLDRRLAAVAHELGISVSPVG
jgi:predicted nucleic acid-binding protein